MISAMLRVEEAQQIVLAEVTAAAPEPVPIEECLGRVLREEVVATCDLPRQDNSAMDGYAIRATDVGEASEEHPVTLPVIGDIPAGHPSQAPLRPGTAMRIMTGAFVPSGADAVVQVEHTDGGMESVSIRRAPGPGANIRPRGEDIREGSRLLSGGMRIGPGELTLLAAAQKATLFVSRRPTVTILSTGDELADIREPLGAEKIVNTNAHLLAALVRMAGARPRVLGIVPDEREATVEAFRSAVQSDFVLSSGGVSVGAFDFVKEALDAVGARTLFWRVAMKPGKPVVFSRTDDCLIFGLPGNPASCFVGFHLFVAPALRKALGEEGTLLPPQVVLPVTAPLKGPGDRRTYVRVRVVARDGALVADPLTAQGSGSLTSMLGANGLAMVEEGVTRVGEGERVKVLLLEEGISSYGGE